MRNIFIPFTLLAVGLLITTGCSDKGYKLATVSGTVTYNGEPVPKLNVVFSPSPVGENHSVGPFSTGQTDENGNFSLKTRHGDKGAVVGNHSVAFEYSDIGETAMGDLRDDLADAQDEGSKENFEKVQKRMVELKAKLKGRPLLDRSYPGTVVVPAAGTDNLVLELTELMEKK